MKTMKQTNNVTNSNNSAKKHTDTGKHIDNLTQSGHVITILDDYSCSATGEYITLDFSNTTAFSPTIVEEAAAVIRSISARTIRHAPSFFRSCQRLRKTRAGAFPRM